MKRLIKNKKQKEFLIQVAPIYGEDYFKIRDPKKLEEKKLEEIVFYSDGTFIQYLYDCGFSNGNLYAYISGTYNIVNGIVKMHETYYYDYDSGASWNTDSKWNFYYDSNKNYFRSTDYYYGDWCYVRYYYKTSPVSKADRVSYYQSHICNEIWI